jgi:predicted permease
MNKSSIVLAVVALFALPLLIFLIIYASNANQGGMLPILIAPIAAILFGGIFIAIADFRKKKKK